MSDKSSNALGLIAIYDSDSSENDSQDNISDDFLTEDKTFINENKTAEKKLPLPSKIKILFNGCWKKDDLHESNPNLHDGRVRTFAHERGNWSTYVFIPFNMTQEHTTLSDELQKKCIEKKVDLKLVAEPHISLTRTVVLLHHWIDAFVSSVREKVSHFKRFFIQFCNLTVYCNEEKTRTFLSLTVTGGDEVLNKTVKVLDDCLHEFKLPPFYENPSFHLSIAWSLGNQKEALERILPLLQEILHKHYTQSPELTYLEISEYMCKSGNKFFTFPLENR